MNDSIDKRFYKIKEVSELLDLPASTLPRRNDGGTRFYTPADIEILKMIKYLIKDKGLKIEAAQEAIRHNHSGIRRHHRAIETLKDVRSRLQSILAALNKLR